MTLFNHTNQSFKQLFKNGSSTNERILPSFTRNIKLPNRANHSQQKNNNNSLVKSTSKEETRTLLSSNTRQNTTKCTNSSRGNQPSKKEEKSIPFRSNPIAWYSQKLESHPLTTKCISSGFICGSADITCQYIVHQRNDNGNMKFYPDWARTGRFTILGSFLIGPVIHHWYKTLLTYIPGTSLRAVLKRTFYDQALFAPLFQPTFLTSLLLLENEKSLHEIPEILVRDVPDLVKSNWLLWIPAMLINFRFVPGKWQVLYSNGVGFVWNVYLSWRTQDK